MDALDRLAGPASDLLGRVDAALERAGARPQHPVWPLLRRLRVLPGAAVRAVSALRPDPPATAAPSLRRLAQVYADARATVTQPLPWSGASAEAFAAHRDALAAHLAGADAGSDDGGLAGRLAATAGYAEALAAWVTRTRAELARALAETLGSAQAVTLVTAPVGAGSTTPPVVEASADVAARVLSPLVIAYDEVADLRLEWAPRVAELAVRPPADAGPSVDPAGTIRLGGG